MNSPAISIVILTWNRPTELMKVWDCNVAPVLGYDPEVIFVDQGSRDDTRDLIWNWQHKHKDKQIIHLRLPHNYGISAGFNQGLRLARGWYLCKMDDDILLPEGWLAGSIEALDAVPQLGFLGFDWGLKAPWHPEILKTTINGISLDRLVGGAFGNNVFRRDFFERIGYYDERFEMYGIEDSDWYNRCRDLGYFNAYLTGMNSRHIGPTSDNRAMKDRCLKLNSQRYDEKWAQPNVPLYYSPWGWEDDDAVVRRQLEGLGYI